MTKGKKGEKPADKLKERQELIEKAAAEFRDMIVEFARDNGLSSVEFFAIMSEAMSRLAQGAVQIEHQEYIGGEAKDDES